MAIFRGHHVEYKDGLNKGQNREATEQEIRSSKDRFHKIRKLEIAEEKVKSKLKTLRGNCPHTVFRDIAGHPYDVRICAACGISLGLI